MPIDDQDPAEPGSQYRAAEIAQERVVGWQGKLRLPPKAMWCSASPIPIVGATTTGAFWPASFSAARRQTSEQRTSSTPVARCGPCCSVDATGRSTMAPRPARSRSSAAVRFCHRTCLIDTPYLPGFLSHSLAAWQPALCRCNPHDGRIRLPPMPSHLFLRHRSRRKRDRSLNAEPSRPSRRRLMPLPTDRRQCRILGA